MKNEKYIPALSFAFLTSYYDRVIKLVMPKNFREIFVQHINLYANETLLDFGTGTAELAIIIKKQIPSVSITGLDIDDKVLCIADKKIKSKNLDIKLFVYNGHNFPFANNCFDKVVSCLVFHHLSPGHKHIVLTEIFRILKSGGKIYIADWGLERNKLKARLLDLFKYINVLKNITEQGNGMLSQYISNSGFKNVIEAGFLKTATGTLCFYEADK